MSKAPAIERLDRKPGGNANLAKACTEIKQWLKSNPSTATGSSFHPGKDDTASPLDEDELTGAKEHGGVSLLSTGDTANTVSPQREPKEKSGRELAQLTPTSHNSLMETRKPLMGHQNLTVANFPAEKQAPASMPSQVLKTVLSSQGQKILKAKRSMSSWSVSDEPSNIVNDQKKEGATDEDFSLFNVASWMLNTTESPTLTFTPDFPDLVAAYKHDIDTCTGEFMPETQYPATLKDHQLGPGLDLKDIAWRQANMTAELQILRELASREKLAAKLRSQLQPKQLPVEVEEDTWPKAECKLRPATPKDFKHIAKIMNLERLATTCPQVLESKDVTASDIQRIFNACRDSLRPFIVATEGEDELFDRAKWPKNADKAYREWVALPKSGTRYAWVYIETFCAQKNDAESKWRAEFLEKYQFTQVAYLPEAVKTDRFYDSQWLDLALWALEVQHRSKIIDRLPGKDLEQ